MALPKRSHASSSSSYTVTSFSLLLMVVLVFVFPQLVVRKLFSVPSFNYVYVIFPVLFILCYSIASMSIIIIIISTERQIPFRYSHISLRSLKFLKHL
jgi:hypothetical protein